MDRTTQDKKAEKEQGCKVNLKKKMLKTIEELKRNRRSCQSRYFFFFVIIIFSFWPFLHVFFFNLYMTLSFDPNQEDFECLTPEERNRREQRLQRFQHMSKRDGFFSRTAPSANVEDSFFSNNALDDPVSFFPSLFPFLCLWLSLSFFFLMLFMLFMQRCF